MSKYVGRHRYTPTATASKESTTMSLSTVARSRLYFLGTATALIAIGVFGTGGDENGPVKPSVASASESPATATVEVPALTEASVVEVTDPVEVEVLATPAQVEAALSPVPVEPDEVVVVSEPAPIVVETSKASIDPVVPPVSVVEEDGHLTEVDNDVVSGILAQYGTFGAQLYCTGDYLPESYSVLGDEDSIAVDAIITVRENQLAAWGNVGSGCDSIPAGVNAGGAVDTRPVGSPDIVTEHEAQVALQAARLATTCDYTGDMLTVLGEEDAPIVNAILYNAGCIG
jgi:hypothetical protein